MQALVSQRNPLHAVERKTEVERYRRQRDDHRARVHRAHELAKAAVEKSQPLDSRSESWLCHEIRWHVALIVLNSVAKKK